jgi:hypothetical protein
MNRFFIPLMLAFLLPACSLQPLYSGGSKGVVARALGTISVAPIEGKNGWLMRNALTNRLGAQGSNSAQFRLVVVLDDQIEGFGVRADDPRFGRMMQLLDALQQRELVSLSQVPMPVTWNQKAIPDADVNLGRVMESKKDRSLLTPRQDGGFDLVSVEATPVLTLYPGAEKDPEGRELMDMLQLGDRPGNFRLMGLETQFVADSMTMRTRSLAALQWSPASTPSPPE